MKRKFTPWLILIVCAALILTGCGQLGGNNTSTEDTMGVNNAPGDQDDGADFLGKEICDSIAPHFGLYYPWAVAIAQATYPAEESGLGGAGCRVFAAGTGDQITDWNTKVDAIFQGIEVAGWVSDPKFIGGGAGGELITVRNHGSVCRLISEVKPASADLCSGDEALAACLARLAPEQIIYQLSADCTPDSYIETEQGAIQPLEPERVEFDPGAVSMYLNGLLEHSNSRTYVLNVSEGQDMVIDLSTNPPLGGLITLFSDDGRVMLSDHGDSMSWAGTMPVTQDYYITVSAGPDERIEFNLKIWVPEGGADLIREYEAMYYEDCYQLSDAISATLGVPAYPTTELFTDSVKKTIGSGCQISAWGDGVEIPDWSAASDAVIALIESRGWTTDYAYGAAGIGGSVMGYRLDNNLCIYVQEVQAQAGVVCPTDQPITVCWGELPPEQLIYSIEMNCATEK